jgi:hypothetical protein
VAYLADAKPLVLHRQTFAQVRCAVRNDGNGPGLGEDVLLEADEEHRHHHAYEGEHHEGTDLSFEVDEAPVLLFHQCHS